MTAAEMTRRLVRSATIELLRAALTSDAAALGATLDFVRSAEGEHIDGQLLDALRAALALVGDGNIFLADGQGIPRLAARGRRR